MPREGTLARHVYGRRDPFPDEVTEIVRLFEGRQPKASRLKTRKLNRRCSDCTIPLPKGTPLKIKDCERCIARNARRPHKDSVMEVRAFKKERYLITGVGRMA